MVGVDSGSLYRRTHSPSRLGWSEGRQPLGAVLHSSNEPGKLSLWLCHDDVQHHKHWLGIIIIIIVIIIIIIHRRCDTVSVASLHLLITQHVPHRSYCYVSVRYWLVRIHQTCRNGKYCSGNWKKMIDRKTTQFA